MRSDIEIAQSIKLEPISNIAKKAGILEDEIYPFGKYKAKIEFSIEERLKNNKNGKLILVTAMNPTPAGEGKTTVTVGLGDSLSASGKKTMIALREPSLGPVFGIKGGAAGGGYSQVLPMEDINLHFTGDMHAISAANNLLCALIDNHIQQGNSLFIDTRRVLFRRVVDMNDRALRHVTLGLGGPLNGVPREDFFMITVASEVMAILCLSENYEDLKERLGNIVIALNTNGDYVYCRDLQAQGAMAALLKDALKPNLVQTIEKTPCIIHGGPFANIAHGCNSVKATKLCLKLSDYCVTEAGFGADLGAEKFFDIKCRKASLSPDCVVLVTTVRALKYNAWIKKEELSLENVTALQKGCENLKRHIENIKKFGLPVVVAINRFKSDTESELDAVMKLCEELSAPVALCEVFEKGSKGGLLLAQKVMEVCEGEKPQFKLLYEDSLPTKEKIRKIVSEIYRGKDVVFEKRALDAIHKIEENGYGNLPVCMAKTQYSFSDDPQKLGAPSDFSLTVTDVKLSAGAGFIVVMTGEIMVMPGLPKSPSAERIDILQDGTIKGLF